MAALAAAPEIPGFHALSPLGAGPSSAIYSAQSERLGRWVALTVYASAPLAKSSSAADVDRFQRAFEQSRRLGAHPHAVTLLDWGITPDGHPYVVTEFYEHGTFDARVTGNQPLPVDKTLRIGIAIAGALETAHRAQLIHGGVHPARILADADDEPSLADTGLVQLVNLSGQGALLGPAELHAPPEVLEGEALTSATDVFGLASTLHTLLTGSAPYQPPAAGDTPAMLLLRILRHEAAPLQRVDAPEQLGQVLRSALHPDPRQRPASIMALAQALQRTQAELGVTVTQPVLLDLAAGIQAPPAPAGPTVPPAPVPAPLADPTPPPVSARSGPPSPAPAAPAPVAHPAPATERPPAAPATERPPAAPATPEPAQLHKAAPGTATAPPSRAFVPYPMPGHDAEPHHDAGTQDAPPAEEPPTPAVQPNSSNGVSERRAKVVSRGPKALPIIVLGAIVALLLGGATWMVLSGSDPSDASPEEDPSVEAEAGP